METTRSETIKNIFKINEITVFKTELRNLIEEIELNNLGENRLFILVNFVLYKLNSLDDYSKKRDEFLINSKLSLKIPELYEQMKSDREETTIKEFKKLLVETLIDLISGLDELNEEVIKAVLNSHPQILINCLLEKTKAKKEENTKLEYNPDTQAGNFADYNDNYFNNLSNNLNMNFPSAYSNIEPTLNADTKSEKFKDRMKNEIDYQCEISYLGGNDFKTQFVKVKSKADFNIFMHALKKKLNIYEYAKFKIMVCDGEGNLFSNISQLNEDSLNKLKFVPFDYM